MAEKDPWDFSEFGAPRAGQSAESDLTTSDSGRDGGTGAGRSVRAADSGFDALSDLGTAHGPATGALAVAGPPLTLLGISAAAAVIGLLLAALLGALPALAVIGWVLAGPFAIGVLALYTTADTRRRAQPIYVAPNWLIAGYYACLAVCLVGVIVSAIRIALWVGRW
ncbi:hypothetical protein [Microlunatus soli]|uniref:Uncharacterized protein n=1 Tax=Microlunatus soli TaxID=630515 RepID=A0A1H1UUC6_9ACTN|nr:hypothetical protein [Microlunatus soli]SDS76198.1 hypothetical protein SAMN04489812_2940 [Microlunatus soli]